MITIAIRQQYDYDPTTMYRAHLLPIGRKQKMSISIFRRSHTGCAKKVTPFRCLSFLPLLDALFAIFVYLHCLLCLLIIFIKCLISEPSVVSIQMDSSVGWCAIAHCEQHDKLPQKGECFIHRTSCVASKQP